MPVITIVTNVQGVDITAKRAFIAANTAAFADEIKVQAGVCGRCTRAAPPDLLLTHVARGLAALHNSARPTMCTHTLWMASVLRLVVTWRPQQPM